MPRNVEEDWHQRPRPATKAEKPRAKATETVPWEARLK